MAYVLPVLERVARFGSVSPLLLGCLGRLDHLDDFALKRTMYFPSWRVVRDLPVGVLHVLTVMAVLIILQVLDLQ